jgi:hypothetical protein
MLSGYPGTSANSSMLPVFTPFNQYFMILKQSNPKHVNWHRPCPTCASHFFFFFQELVHSCSSWEKMHGIVANQ